METIRNYLLLKEFKHIGDGAVIKLVEHFASLKGIFKRSEKELKQAGLSDRQIESLHTSKPDEKWIDEELELIQKHQMNMISYESDHYPAMLRETAGSPSLLYHYGQMEPLQAPAIGIVGARQASTHAQRFTHKLAADLAEAGLNVVSGFAAGIDINAHLGALKKGTTTAVMGNGFLNIYPPSNKKFVKKIIQNGCFITEFPMKTTPDSNNFPRRNRIISGLSHGIVVVEAAPKSGSLITAKYALDQNREVFAVPAWPETFHNATNDLIRKGATLVENYLDIIEELTHLSQPMKVVDKDINDNNMSFDSEIKKQIYQQLLKEHLTLDELHHNMKTSINILMAETAEMEMEDFIVKDLNGKYSARKLNG